MAGTGSDLVRVTSTPNPTLNPIDRFAGKWQPLRPLRILPLLLLGLAACSSPIKPPEPVEGDHALVIQVQGLDCCKGVLRVALYNGADYWLDEQGMVPREPYGFSGNPGSFGRPSFEAARVKVAEDTEIHIAMRPPPF